MELNKNLAESAEFEVTTSHPVIPTGKPILLKPRTYLESNLLGVPLGVLNTKATKINRELCYAWITKNEQMSIFKFVRPENIPFPQLEHVEYFYALLAMFSQNMNDRGEIKTRLIDIARNAGKTDLKSGRTYESVKEMIWRFSQCTAHWHQAWLSDDKEKNTWHGTLIMAENVFDATEFMTLRRNPRNSKSIEKWHTIRLNPMVVESLKASYVRVFLTKKLQSDLSLEAKLVYRYFFGFSDKSAVTRDYNKLMQVFPWYSQKSRFIPWLKKSFEELKDKKLINDYQLNDSNAVVKCASIKEIELLEMKERSKIETKKIDPDARKTDNWSDTYILSVYTFLFEKGLIEKDSYSTFQQAIKIDQKIAVKAVRNRIKSMMSDPLIKEAIFNYEN